MKSEQFRGECRGTGVFCGPPSTAPLYGMLAAPVFFGQINLLP